LTNCIVGIDYSLSSPAITVIKNEEAYFYFMISSDKKYPMQSSNQAFHLIPTIKKKLFDNNLERYHYLSTWAINILKGYSVERISIEDFSFGSSGSSILNIAENAGILKYRIQYELGQIISLVSPKTIKKFATGSGNANKEQMEICFEEMTSLGLRTLLTQTAKQFNPSSDIIDSWFLCQYTKEQ
jgi:Holliday junction resolvasome RuvABC endonuclease subunit